MVPVHAFAIVGHARGAGVAPSTSSLVAPSTRSTATISTRTSTTTSSDRPGRTSISGSVLISVLQGEQDHHADAVHGRTERLQRADSRGRAECRRRGAPRERVQDRDRFLAISRAVTPADPLTHAAALMSRQQRRISRGCEDRNSRQLVGVITDRDITIRHVASARRRVPSRPTYDSRPQGDRVAPTARVDRAASGPRQGGWFLRLAHAMSHPRALTLRTGCAPPIGSAGRRGPWCSWRSCPT